MAFKPPVKAGDSFRIEYGAALNSGGTTLVRVIWIPKHGQGVPDPEHVEVVPGESGVIEGTVPSAAASRWLEVWVDLPDGTGSGKLKLEVDGKAHSQADLTTDVLWTSLVLP